MRDMNMRDMEDPGSDFFRFLEGVPTQGYLGFSFGAMLLSAFFFLIGKRSTALFLGQWVPSIGMFALVYKLLRPSYERPMEQMGQTASEMGSKMKSAARDVASKIEEPGTKMGMS